MGRPLRQMDVQKVIAAAIKGGMPAGTFSVEVDAERGRVVVWPLDGKRAHSDENELDAEIRGLLDG